MKKKKNSPTNLKDADFVVSAPAPGVPTNEGDLM